MSEAIRMNPSALEDPWSVPLSELDPSQRFSKPTANSAFSNVYGLKTLSISMKPASSDPIGRSPSSTTL